MRFQFQVAIALLLTTTACVGQSATHARVAQGGLSPQDLPAPLSALVGSLDPGEELRVDLADRFWSWKADTREVTRFEPEGQRGPTVRLPAGVAVDAHSTWGVLRLASGGEELQHFDWQGALQGTLPLTGAAGSVKWLGQEQVALTPKRSKSWVEIWDLKVGARVRTIGEAEPVETVPGGRFSRGVRLQPFPAKTRLYTLESRTGEVRIFSYDGEILRRAEIGNPRLEEYEEWIAEVSADYEARGESVTPTIWQLDLTVSDDGSLWTDTTCELPEGRLSLAELPEQGNLQVHLLKSECCPQGLTAWRDLLILWNPPGRPQPACREIRRLP